MHSPKQIVVFQSRHQFVGTVFGERNGLINRRVFIADAVNSPVGVVAQVGFVGIAHAHLEAVGFGVVLNNKTIPIGHPNRAVGTHFGKHGRHPLVGSRQQIKRLLVFVVAAVFNHQILVQHVARWFGHKGHLVPIFFGKSPRRVKIMASGGGVAPKNVHLPHARRNGFHVFVRVCSATAVVGSHARFARKIAVRNGHVPTVRIVSR